MSRWIISESWRGIFPAIVFTVGYFFFHVVLIASVGISIIGADATYREITRGIRIKKKHDTHTRARFVTPYAACLCDLTPRAIRSRETRADRYRDKDLTRFPRFGRIIDPSPTPFPPLLLESSSLPAEVSSAKWISILSGSTQLVLAHDRSSCLQLSESFKLIS